MKKKGWQRRMKQKSSYGRLYLGSPLNYLVSPRNNGDEDRQQVEDVRRLHKPQQGVRMDGFKLEGE